jgi:pimeloyl-ACP methyl ester carboxylesterase
MERIVAEARPVRASMPAMRLALALVIFATACGDNQAPPAVDAFQGSASLQFSQCQDPQISSLECGTLVVPADWSNPSGATISLPVVRAVAKDPSKRIGVLTFNFGGPGEGTLSPIALNYPGEPFFSATDLTQYFDFVLMDWRGVATTTPELLCLGGAGGSATGTALANERFAPGSDGEWADLFSLVTEVNAGCAANTANAPLLAHQDTESAARDLDALRTALNEDKMNYWGVSYGTRLGAMYAELFPDHARAIALDSPVTPVPELKSFLQGQSISFDTEISRFFDWCATASGSGCPFQTGDGQGSSVATEFEALLDTADATPVSSEGITLDRATIDLIATNLMYFPVYEWPRLGRGLSRLEAGDGSAMATIFMTDQIDYANDDNSFSTYQNVCSQDLPLPSDINTPSTYQAWVETQPALAPHVGLQNAAAQAFIVGWPGTVPVQQVIGATTAPPLLITATRHDPATPYDGAIALQSAFANGSYLVTYEGDGHANAQFEQCLGDQITAFLIDPTVAPTTTDCPVVPIDAPRPPRPYRVGKRPRR